MASETIRTINLITTSFPSKELSLLSKVKLALTPRSSPGLYIYNQSSIRNMLFVRKISSPSEYLNRLIIMYDILYKLFGMHHEFIISRPHKLEYVLNDSRIPLESLFLINEKGIYKGVSLLDIMSHLLLTLDSKELNTLLKKDEAKILKHIDEICQIIKDESSPGLIFSTQTLEFNKTPIYLSDFKKRLAIRRLLKKNIDQFLKGKQLLGIEKAINSEADYRNINLNNNIERLITKITGKVPQTQHNGESNNEHVLPKNIFYSAPDSEGVIYENMGHNSSAALLENTYEDMTKGHYVVMLPAKDKVARLPKNNTPTKITYENFPQIKQAARSVVTASPNEGVYNIPNRNTVNRLGMNPNAPPRSAVSLAPATQHTHPERFMPDGRPRKPPPRKSSNAGGGIETKKKKRNKKTKRKNNKN